MPDIIIIIKIQTIWIYAIVHPKTSNFLYTITIINFFLYII